MTATTKPKPDYIPVGIRRALAEASFELKREILAKLAAGEIAPKIALMCDNATNSKWTAIVGDYSGSCFSFAKATDHNTFELLDKLEPGPSAAGHYAEYWYSNTELIRHLLANVVDQSKTAELGVVTQDYTFGSNSKIDRLLQRGAGVHIEGVLTIVGGDNPVHLGAVSYATGIVLENYPIVDLPALSQVGNMHWNGQAQVTAASLRKAESLTTNCEDIGYFRHCLQEITDPFTEKVTEDSARFVPVVIRFGKSDPGSVGYYGGSPLYIASYKDPIEEVLIWDKHLGMATPSTAVLFNEDDLGKYARLDAQRRLDRPYAEVVLGLRSDGVGVGYRKQQAEYYHGSVPRGPEIPEVFQRIVYPLTLKQSPSEIQERIAEQPLSIIYGCEELAIYANPLFVEVATTANPVVEQLLVPKLGGDTILGVARVHGSPDISLLTNGGFVYQGTEDFGIVENLRNSGVPVVDELSDLAPHPIGYLMSVRQITKFTVNKSNLMHVLLDRDVRKEGFKIDNFLPEYGYLVNAKDKNGETPLNLAYRQLDFQAIKVFNQHGVEYPEQGSDDYMQIYRSALNTKNLVCISLLVESILPNMAVIELAIDLDLEDAASLLVLRSKDLCKEDVGAVLLAVDTGSLELFTTAANTLDAAEISWPVILKALDAGRLGMAEVLIEKTTAHLEDPDFFTQIKDHPKMNSSLFAVIEDKDRDGTLTRA